MAKEEVIGSPRRNLVFETSGVIRVKVGDKYYKLNYSKEESNEEDTESLESKIIITNNIASYESGLYAYPGDEKIIFALNDGIYYTLDGNYINFNTLMIPNDKETTKIFDNTVIFKGNPAFTISNSKLINNLNAQFLDGHSWNEILSRISSISNPTFNTLETSDGEFSVSEGTVTCNTIICDNVSVKNISFENISGNIIVGGDVTVSDSELYINGKLCDFGVNIFQLLYKLYSTKGIDTDKTTFVDFAKNFVKSINSNYNWQTPSTYASHQVDFDRQLLNESLYWEPINIESWKNTLCIPLSVADTYYVDPEELSESSETAENIKRSSNLYNEILTKIYIIPEESKPIFYGVVLKLYLSSGFVSPRTEGELIIRESKTVENSEESIITDTKTKFIVTGMNDNEVYVHTLYDSNITNLLTLTTDSIELYPYVEEDYSTESEKNPFTTINVQFYSVPDEDSEYYNTKLYVIPESVALYKTSTTVIGDLSAITDSNLNLSGLGFYSNNCYLDNPEIYFYNKTEQKSYLKLSVTDISFLGINDIQDNWIKIDNVGNGSITTSTYTLKSNGELNIGGWINVEKLSVGSNDFIRCNIKRGDMYDINNYNSFCKFGQLTIQEDGSATLGSGETQITISASGEVKIPAAAIIE